MKQLLILFLITSTFCFAQQEKFKQLDSYLGKLFLDNKIMGTVVVSKNGHVIYDKSVGYSNILDTNKMPITEKSKFRIASITKTYTATMIYQLIDEGKLKLTDKLSSYFPQIPNAENILIANLLNHSSGLFEITSEASFKTWHLKETTSTEMLERMQKHPGVFQPNEKSEYSNSNFLLLGYILEKIDNTTYAQVLQKRIVNRIGLKNTYYGRKIDGTNNECSSYHYKKGTLSLVSETHMSVPGGAGGIVATPYDLIRFYEALFTGELMSPESFSKMTSTKSVVYGSGIFKGEMYGQDSYGHGGSIDGFTSEITYIPEEKVAVVLLTNALNYPMSNVISNAFLASQNKGIEQPMVSMESIELIEEQVKAYAGDYEGFFGSEKEPITFVVVAEGNVLKGGFNPNSLFKFKPIKKDEFVHETFGVHLKFNLKQQTFTFNQAGIEPKTFTKKQ